MNKTTKNTSLYRRFLFCLCCWSRVDVMRDGVGHGAERSEVCAGLHDDLPFTCSS